ncbi:LOW QUALITY PROTEIN: ANO6 isoform 4 [Pongo abelii]|uniref:ANO6 isoform 4 n=1 Tax=Pongo abelii TaxID=9601 RepID=A0A2J8WCP4_PONAB|nr:LOW QUALITY PROTEIN: ANO6 isoform 4 [Pongo abelii]
MKKMSRNVLLQMEEEDDDDDGDIGLKCSGQSWLTVALTPRLK